MFQGPAEIILPGFLFHGSCIFPRDTLKIPHRKPCFYEKVVVVSPQWEELHHQDFLRLVKHPSEENMRVFFKSLFQRI